MKLEFLIVNFWPVRDYGPKNRNRRRYAFEKHDFVCGCTTEKFPGVVMISISQYVEIIEAERAWICTVGKASWTLE